MPTSTSKKSIVVFGGFGHEGIYATIQSLGYDLVAPNLARVKPKTWWNRVQTIRTMRESNSLAAVIFYLHSTLFLEAAKPDYSPAFFEMIEESKKVKSIMFAFQDNIDGIFSPRSIETGLPFSREDLERFFARGDSLTAEIRLRRFVEWEGRKEEVAGFTKSLLSCGIELAPFYRRNSVTIRLQEFLEDLEQHVFLRLFIPNERYQADQIGNLLSVLERYLRQVEGQKFSVNERKSEKGVTYIFRSEECDGDVLTVMNAAIGRFDDFMKLCGDNPESAEGLLKKKGFTDVDAAFAVKRYARDYQRLLLDTKHEFERKMLLLKQQFENDCIEGSIRISTDRVDSNLSSLLSTDDVANGLAIQIGSVSIMNAAKAESHVNTIINGGVVYSPEDKTFIDLFSKFSDKLERIQNRSDLDQLKDASTPEPAKINAVQRLTAFLRRAASKAGEISEKVAVEVLTKYLQGMLSPPS